MQQLRLVNDVLLQAGERPVTSLVTPVGRKGALSVRAAVEDITLLNSWPFLARKLTPLPASGATTLVVSPLRKITAVEFNGRNLTPVGLDEVSRTPNSFAIVDEETIEVNPGGAFTQYTVYGEALLDYDEEDPDEIIPLPKRFRELLMVQAVYRMAVNHLGDPDLANLKANEFAVMARQMMAREIGVGTKSLNMYRKRVYGY